MKKVVVTGKILVEIMADTTGDGFPGPQPLTGPYPSGAPAIIADQTAMVQFDTAGIVLGGDHLGLNPWRHLPAGEAMLAAPGNWARHHCGSERELWLQRHFSLSDRVRYYWPGKTASEAVDKLLKRLEDRQVPACAPVFPGYGLAAEPAPARAFAINAVKDVLRLYEGATGTPVAASLRRAPPDAPFPGR